METNHWLWILDKRSIRKDYAQSYAQMFPLAINLKLVGGLLPALPQRR